MRYTGHELRWHFRNGTYKEIDKVVLWVGDFRALGYIYKRLDGRFFVVWFVKYKGEKSTSIKEFRACELAEYIRSFEELRNHYANEYKGGHNV